MEETKKKEFYSYYLKRPLRDKRIIKMILADENNMEMLNYILDKEKQYSFTEIPNKNHLKVVTIQKFVNRKIN